MRQSDRDAFVQLFELEVFLRRVLRWELRGRYGREWLLKLGDLTAVINERRARERELSPLDPKCSDLAFLGLPEVIQLMFVELWDQVFRGVFANRRNLRHSPLRDVVAIRNKVAHFRPLNSTDASLLRRISEVLDPVVAYYNKQLEASDFISGEPGTASELPRDEDLQSLIASLRGVDLDGVWAEFGALESFRARGLSLGLGLVDRHLYLEIYTQSAFRAEQLNAWALKRQHELTFVLVGNDSSFIRMFVPICLGQREVLRAMRALTNVALESQAEGPQQASLTKSDFDFGSIEWVIGEGHNASFGFAF